MGRDVTKKPCNWRIGAQQLNAGCTINETGHCTRHACPFVKGYIKRVQDEMEVTYEKNHRVQFVTGDHR